MIIRKKSDLELQRKKIDGAAISIAANADSISDIEAALVELGELIAAELEEDE